MRPEITVEFLLANTRKRGQCRVWQGTVKKKTGLPQLGLNGRKLNVARLVYALTHPLDPPRDDEAVVHVHECDYRSCIEPEHLVCVPQAQAWRYRKMYAGEVV